MRYARYEGNVISNVVEIATHNHFVAITIIASASIGFCVLQLHIEDFFLRLFYLFDN